MKYTKEVLERAVEQSVSIMSVLRLLGVSPHSGGMHYYISKLVKKYDIDTSHFLGRTANSGPGHKGGSLKLTAEEVLVNDRRNGRREKLHILKRVLKDIGRVEICSKCGIGDRWNNEPLTLQIDHIDGNALNNVESNVRFLCPNCHSQTETHSRIKPG